MGARLAIDTDAVRALASRLDRTADDAAQVASRVLNLATIAALDEAPAATFLRRVDEDVGLVAAVLRSRAAQADYPLRDVVAMTLAAEATRATDALARVAGPDRALAAAGADAARRLRARGVGDLELLRDIAARSPDASYAWGFARELPLVDTAALVLASSSSGPYGADATIVTSDERSVWAATHRQLLDALGQAYAAAGRWSGAHALAAVSAAQWVTAVTSGARGTGAALALLLTHGAVDDEVTLAAIADGVYRYERATADGDAPLWAPRSLVGLRYVGPVAPDGTRAYDPLATILRGLGAHAVAAQAFLIGGDTVTRTFDGDDVRPVQERLAYLLERRRWPTDDGAGLGDALAAATTAFRDRTLAGRRSAELAAQTVALVGGQTGRGSGGWWVFARDGWRAPTDLRPALSTIVASYMPDVFDTVQTHVSTSRDEWSTIDGPSFPRDGPYGAAFTVAGLAAVVEAIGADPDGVRRVVSAVLGTERLRLAHAIDRLAATNPHLAADLLTDAGGGARASLALVANAVSAGGGALGFVVAHGYRGARDDEERRAAAQREVADLMRLLVDLPLAPLPTGPWGKAVLDQATGAALDAWQQAGRPSGATAAYASLDEATVAALRAQVLDDLAARGLLHPAEPISGYEPPPADAFVRAAGGGPASPLRFDRASDAYRRWVSAYAPLAWLQVQVELFYAGAFGRVR